MPIGSGLSPVLKAVPSLSSSQDETFFYLNVFFCGGFQFVGLGQFDQVFYIVPVAQSYRETICLLLLSLMFEVRQFDSKAGLFTVSIYNQTKPDKGGHE